MPAALLNQGKTAIRDSLKTLVTHVGIATDTTAFAVGQTAMNPAGGGTNIIKASTEVDVDTSTFDASATITSADGTGSFRTVSILNGPSVTGALSRSVRTNGIGIDAGDSYTVTVRVAVADNS